MRNNNRGLLDFVEYLNRFDDHTSDKNVEYMQKYITSESFYKMLFGTDGSKTEEFRPATERLYGLLATRKKVFKTLVNAVAYSYDELDRSASTWLYSVVKVAVGVSAKKEDELERNKSNLSKTEYKIEREKIDSYNEYIAKLLKFSKKINKSVVKKLTKTTGAPKELIYSLMLNLPETKYIDGQKIGYFLNIILTDIYKYANENVIDNVDNISWKKLFKELFGEDKTVEVATIVMLEGVQRLQDYSKHDKQVKAVWEDLTIFALKELESAPMQLKDKMLGLYTKRLNKMFSNDTYELRADLLSIDKNKYPELASAIGKFSDKIKEAMKQ